MVTDWFERDGRLADGTPLCDVAADMPVQVRDAGTLDWHTGVVISVHGQAGPELNLAVQLDGIPRPLRFAPDRVRRRRA